uniref:Uncharacterized protein n=1 Tax=Arundo donax TaxID=35708 RepID=A0A0A9C4W1_ARUDO
MYGLLRSNTRPSTSDPPVPCFETPSPPLQQVDKVYGETNT